MPRKYPCHAEKTCNGAVRIHHGVPWIRDQRLWLFRIVCECNPRRWVVVAFLGGSVQRMIRDSYDTLPPTLLLIGI